MAKPTTLADTQPRLADVIESTRPDPKPCKVERLLAKIHPDDLDAFMAMLMDEHQGHTELAVWLSKMADESISDNTLGEWRRKRGVNVASR